MQKGGQLMKRLVRLFVTAALLAAAAPDLRAQYYSWGADAPQRWSELRGGDVRVVYPDTLAAAARRIYSYTQAVRPVIGTGFERAPLRGIPFVLHPDNFRSNGLVMWLPKRIELLTTPAADAYAWPWYRQLVSHEYRHAVQYAALDRGLPRVLSWVLGEQGKVTGLLFLPVWLLEGDATLCETQLAPFGRGLQPSFTMAYRALGDEMLRRRNHDLWFCGSYRRHIPDHYRLGYQIAAYTETRYGRGVWDRTARFAVRNPYYLVFAPHEGLKRAAGTTVGTLFEETFERLVFHWNAIGTPDDTPRTVAPLEEDNYTTYAHPLPLGDDRLLALKSDYDRPTRFVVTDYTGRERELRRTGAVSSRPATDGRSVWWTEYRRSLLFDERVTSQLCRLDLATGRTRRVADGRNILYPAPAGRNGLAWVRYAPEGRYRIELGGRRWEMPLLTELHGLAWDDATQALYFLATDDRGMWIGRADDGGSYTEILPPSYATLSDLRAGGGRLYFGSIRSGRDEAHALDLATGREWQLTESAYGSFSPAPLPGGEVAVTTYDRRGYRLALQRPDTLRPVRHARLPRNLVNPEIPHWSGADPAALVARADSTAAPAPRRYRRGTHLLRVHSWMPVAVDLFEAVDEQDLNLTWGATAVSQNLLSSATAYAYYGWDSREGSLVKGAFRYDGLGVALSAEATWGGEREVYALVQSRPDGRPERQPLPEAVKYWSLSAGATLPLVFDRGYHLRTLALSAAWNYSNGATADLSALRYDADGRITNLAEAGYNYGLHKLSFGAAFSDCVRLAHRDFAPPKGYALAASYTLNPANRDFADLVSVYGKLYTPGFLRHNSLTVEAAYQTSLGGYRHPNGLIPLTYRSTRLLPRGFRSSEIVSRNYFAARLDYEFPLCYPEGGIGSVVYFKRIRLKGGVDYAQFDLPLAGAKGTTQRIHSYGGELVLDFNVARQPASGTSTLRVGAYAPSKGGVWWTAGIGLPF